MQLEVEFYESYPAIPPTQDQPGEPAQYEIAAVRPYELRNNEFGFVSTVRCYLETPAWLADLLLDAVSEDKLAEWASES